MTGPALTRQEVVERLMEVFRAHGYEGASLSLIAAATGLGRSSLYHYFPKGKEDMADAALRHAACVLRERAVAPLMGDGPPRERLRRFAEGLDAFYLRGTMPCLTVLFTSGDAAAQFQPKVAPLLRGLIGALAKLAEDAGLAPDEAARRAEDAVIALHGSLMIGRALGSEAPFRRFLGQLPSQLLGPDGQ